MRQKKEAQKRGEEGAYQQVIGANLQKKIYVDAIRLIASSHTPQSIGGQRLPALLPPEQQSLRTSDRLIACRMVMSFTTASEFELLSRL